MVSCQQNRGHDANNMFPSERTIEKDQTYLWASLAWQLQLNTSCSRIRVNIWSQRSGCHYLWDFIFCPVSSHTSSSFSPMRTSSGSDSPERFTANCSHLSSFRQRGSSCCSNAEQQSNITLCAVVNYIWYWSWQNLKSNYLGKFQLQPGLCLPP